MSGNKTHEHQVRQFQQGETSQDWRLESGKSTGRDSESGAAAAEPSPGESPTGISQHGMNQESRHNKDGQSGSQKNQR
jgi:hypothetical protein